MTKILSKAKTIIENIKHRINDFFEDRDAEMEKWKEEDPEGYYEYVAMQYREKY